MNIKLTLSAIVMAFSFGLNAQTFTLETISVPAEKISNGKDGSTMHTEIVSSTTLSLPVKWDTSFGGYWADGWAISQKYDSTRETGSSVKHLYSAITYKGYDTSNTFTIGYRNVPATLNTGSNKYFKTIQVTNCTYTYNSMQRGDQFAKKFGGASGDDKDSLILQIDCFDKQTSKLIKTTQVILADFRFTDNSKDYILDTWKEVNVTGDSLVFSMKSSDNGQHGMNTPGYYAVDQFTTTSKSNVVSATGVITDIFPNPSAGAVNIRSEAIIQSVYVSDINGKFVTSMAGNSRKTMTLDLSKLSQGVYFVKISTPQGSGVQKFIKK